MSAKILVAAILIALTTQSAAYAADAASRAASRERELGRRVQLLQRENRELDEKVKSLETSMTEAKEASERARNDASAASGRVAIAEKVAADLRAQIAAKDESLNRQSLQVKQLQQQLKEMSERVTQGDTEKRELQTLLEKQRQTIGRQGQLVHACRGENGKLEALTADLLERLKNEPQSRVDGLLGFAGVDAYNDYEAFRSRHDAIRRGTVGGSR